MTRTNLGRTVGLAVAVAALVACGDGGETGPAPPAVTAARREAARNACIAAELMRRAEDDVLTLSSTLPAEGTVQRMAAEAALSFARAYQQHAELRTGAFAYLDSAINHSRTATDSARYMERAQGFTLRPPAPESVEMNVLQAYERNLQAFRANDDHPCNWDFPDEGGA